MNRDALVLIEPAYKQFWGIYRPEQQKARRDVIELSGEVCAISKETTPGVLELSHVVDVFRGGPYGTNNCLLLRADLHWLFDSHLLRIDADTGNVMLESAVSARYREELKDMRLDETVRARLSEALAMWNKQRSIA